MAKTGRNDPCPCGSGKKFKNCCAGKPVEATPNLAGAPARAATRAPAATMAQKPLTLRGEVQKVQLEAKEKRSALWTQGVFVFFSTREGDGWLLDASAMDALQVASGGRPIEVEVVQTADSIEITWSHTFVIDKNFTVTDYRDKRQTTHASYPASRIRELVAKVRDSLSPEMLATLHLP